MSGGEGGFGKACLGEGKREGGVFLPFGKLFFFWQAVFGGYAGVWFGMSFLIRFRFQFTRACLENE